MSNLDKKNLTENNEKQKEIKVDLKQVFLKKFVRENLEGSEKNKFLDEISENESLNGTDLEKKLKEFKSKNDKFSDFDLKNINIFDLKRAVWKDYLKLDNWRKNYLEKVFSEYKLDDEEKKKLESRIKKLSLFDLENFISSEKESRKYLEKVFWKKLEKQDSFQILSKLNSENTRLRLKSLPNDKKIIIEKILSWISNTWKVTDSDLRVLFESDFFSHAEKREFIKNYIPFITLQKAVDINLLTKGEAEKYKKNIIEKEFKKEKSFFNFLKKNRIDNSDIEEFVNAVNLSDLKISTDNFMWNESDLDKLADKIWFANFEADLNNSLEEVKEDYLWKWPKNLEELKKALEAWDEWKNKISWVSKFDKWNILEVSILKKDWKKETSYLEIINYDDKNKEFSYKLIWNEDKIIANPNTEITKNTYLWFLDSFNKNKNLSLNILDKKELEEKINSWTLKREINTFEQIWEDGLKKEIENLNNSLKNKRKELEKRNKSKEVKDRVDELNEDINKLEEDLKKSKKEKDYEKQTEILEQINNKKEELDRYFDVEKDPEYKEILEKIYKKNDQLNNLEEINFNNLLKVLDLKDPDWKDIESWDWRKGLFKWMYLETKDGIFEITWIDKDNWLIELRNPYWVKDRLDFTTFSEAFKKQEKVNRVKPISDFWELVKLQQWKNDWWKDYEFENWKLITKKAQDWYEKNLKKEVNFLVSDKENDILKFKVNWWEVDVWYWERKDLWDYNPNNKQDAKILKSLNAKKDKNWKYSWEHLSISNKKETYTLNEFQKIINQEKYNFKPDWQTWKTKKISDPQENQNEFRWVFATRFFDRISISEMVAGWKIMIDGITESLKRWNDVHSAKVALTMWSMLPEEIRSDLKIKVEQAEWEAMEKALKWLSSVDSPIATKRIEKWLLNKDTPEYKKEAWLLFMLEKYGHLTAKWPLYPYRWKFLWYEALGGEIWDDLYLSIEKEANESNITFSEEYLVHILLKRQCSWKMRPDRRSRLHKEYEWKWKAWIWEEMEKWYKDANNKRAAKDMVKWGMDELTWWTTSNAIWWFKKAIERWWTLEEMSEWFFCMLYSGALYNVDQATFLKIKWLFDWDQMPMIMARFSSYKSDMQLFNDTVLELSKEIWNAYWEEFPNIEVEAKKIFNDAKNWKWKEKNRILETQSFWKKYWKPLSRALNMVHSWDNTYSKTDKIVFLKSKENPVFWEYYKSIRSFATEWTFKKDFMEDAMWEAWVSWLNTNQVTKQFLKMDVWWSMREWKAASNVWKKISQDIFAVPWMDLSESDKRKYLLKSLRDLTSWFISNHWWRKDDALKSYNLSSTNIWHTLNSWWLYVEKDFSWFSPEEINDENNQEVNSLLSNVVNNILSWNTKNTEDSWLTWLYDVLKEAQNSKKDDVKNILEEA